MQPFDNPSSTAVQDDGSRATAATATSKFGVPCVSKEFGLPYYANLITRCRILRHDDHSDANEAYKAIQKHIERYDATIDRTSAQEKRSAILPTWLEVSGLELAMCDVLPVEELKPRRFRLRREFEQIGNPDIFKKYLTEVAAATRRIGEAPPSESKRSEDAFIRADARFLTMEVERYRLGVISLDQERLRIQRKLMVALGTVSGLSAISYFFAHWFAVRAFPTGSAHAFWSPEWAYVLILLCAALSGALGAGFSMLVRAQRASRTSAVRDSGDTVAILEVIRNRINEEWLLSLFVGALAGIILTTLVASGLLAGTLFTVLPKDQPPQLWLLWTWCFISGFSERLVPDVLDSFTERAHKMALPGQDLRDGPQGEPSTDGGDGDQTGADRRHRPSSPHAAAKRNDK